MSNAEQKPSYKTHKSITEFNTCIVYLDKLRSKMIVVLPNVYPIQMKTQNIRVQQVNCCHLYTLLLQPLLTASSLDFISAFSLPFLPFIPVITPLLLCYHSLPLGCLLAAQEGSETRRKGPEMETSERKSNSCLVLYQEHVTAEKRFYNEQL